MRLRQKRRANPERLPRMTGAACGRLNSGPKLGPLRSGHLRPASSTGGDSGESPSGGRRELFLLSNPAQVRVLRKSAPAPVVVTLSASEASRPHKTGISPPLRYGVPAPPWTAPQGWQVEAE